MLDSIPKAIVYRYINLVERSSVKKEELSEFISTVERLKAEGFLIDQSVFRQKIEIIINNAYLNLVTLQRKRSAKKGKLNFNENILSILKRDVKGFKHNEIDINDTSSISLESNPEITFDSVKLALQNIVLSKRRIKSELELEKDVHSELTKIFGKENVHRQYSVGGFLALKTDIDLGNGKVGIELKIEENLTATDMQRLIGQVLYYRNRVYNNSMILFIASKKTISPSILELKKFVEEIGVEVIYSTAIDL